MKKSVLRLFALALAVGLLFSLTACGGDVDPISSVIGPGDESSVPGEEPASDAVNMFTGIADGTPANARPIGIVVTDENTSVVQIGLEAADMYFEAETEGGIPRILAFFASPDRLPDAIGPVRSARPHFVKMAAALDSVYGHVGGSPTGLQTIKDLGVNDLSKSHEKNTILTNSSNVSWNRTAFVKSKVQAEIANRNLATTTDRKSPFVFGEKEGDALAETVQVRISGSYTMAFTYNATTGKYEKHRNKLSTAIHKTYSGETITAENVIVMFDRRTIDETYGNKKGGTTTRYNFDLNSGEGMLASGGTCRPIRWTRTNSQLSYFEADGITPLTVATGKTYICLTSTEYKDKTTFE